MSRRTNPLTRSEQMSRIRSRDTCPETKLRRAMWKVGMRYRVNYTVGRVRADVAFPGRRTLVFIDGCFWHGCPEHYVSPRSRAEFWAAKLLQNVERDIAQTAALRAQGWRVVRFWEHEVFLDTARCVLRVQAVLEGGADGMPGALRVCRARRLEERDWEEWTLVDLYDPGTYEVVTRRRQTTKWKVTGEAGTE